MQRITYGCFHLESSWWTHSGEGRSCSYRPTTSVKSTCWVRTTDGTNPSSDAVVTDNAVKMDVAIINMDIAKNDSEFYYSKPMCLKLRLTNIVRTVYPGQK